MTLLQAVALSVDDGILDKAGLTLAGLKVTVGSKANGNTEAETKDRRGEDPGRGQHPL